MDKFYKALEKAMWKAEAAEFAFRQQLAWAEVNKQALNRAKDRIVHVGGLNRVRGRKALGLPS